MYVYIHRNLTSVSHSDLKYGLDDQNVSQCSLSLTLCYRHLVLGSCYHYPSLPTHSQDANVGNSVFSNCVKTSSLPK